MGDYLKTAAPISPNPFFLEPDKNMENQSPHMYNAVSPTLYHHPDHCSSQSLLPHINNCNYSCFFGMEFLLGVKNKCVYFNQLLTMFQKITNES